jgi:hypothetical protein
MQRPCRDLPERAYPPFARKSIYEMPRGGASCVSVTTLTNISELLYGESMHGADEIGTARVRAALDGVTAGKRS